jgi:aminoglycoside phosphotransferase (APT) family kinase protein
MRWTANSASSARCTADAVPVARAHALCTDDGVIGSMFYVMDCVEGRVLWDPQLPGMTPDRARERISTNSAA